MQHLYWHRDGGENTTERGLLSARRIGPQLSRPSCGNASVDKAPAYGPVAPNCVEPRAPSTARFRPQKPQRPSGVQLFFNAGPLVPHPSLDLCLISLDGPSLRFLGTPSQGTQKSPNMVHMVADAEQDINQLRHPRTCPKIRRESGGLGPFQELPFQGLLGFFLKFLRAAGRFCLNGLLTLIEIGRFPSPDASAVHTHHTGNLNRLVVLIQQGYRATSTAFQFLWASLGPHSNTSDPEYRTLLCRSQ